MGKLNNLFSKLKGFFNRNKSLPESTQRSEILSETEQPTIVTTKTPHQLFVEQQVEAAKVFNPSQMPLKDAIMHILEERGLDAAFAKNPTIKNSICTTIEGRLANSGITEITLDNLDDVKNVLFGQTSENLSENAVKYNSPISIENGEITFKDETPYYGHSSSTTFKLNKNDNSIQEISSTASEYQLSTEHNSPDFNKKKVAKTFRCSTFNKDGLEINKTFKSENYLRRIDNGKFIDNITPTVSWEIQRNDDLITGTYTQRHPRKFRTDTKKYLCNW